MCPLIFYPPWSFDYHFWITWKLLCSFTSYYFLKLKIKGCKKCSSVGKHMTLGFCTRGPILALGAISAPRQVLLLAVRIGCQLKLARRNAHWTVRLYLWALLRNHTQWKIWFSLYDPSLLEGVEAWRSSGTPRRHHSSYKLVSRDELFAPGMKCPFALSACRM